MIEGTNVLLVDDAPEILDLLRDFFLLNGCEVKTAKDGKETLKAIEAKHFDIVILDIGLPDIDGLSLIDEIKNKDPFCGILMLTGRTEPELIVEAIKKGASDFLVKPVDFERLLLTVFRIQRERSSLNKEGENFNDKRKIEVLNRELQNKIKELTLMYHISNKINSIKISEDIFEKILLIIKDVSRAKAAGFYFLGEEGFICYKESGFFKKGPDLKETEIKKIRSGKHLLKNGDIFMPLFIRGECFGFVRINLENRRNIDSEIFLLKLLLENSATQIENRMLYQSLFENVLQTLKSLISAIQRRDLYTETHCLRVTEFSLAISERIGLPEYERDSLRIACSIHDVGKIGIPDSILLKPAKLTEEEFSIIKKHPIYGEEILGRFEILSKEAKIIRHHHERFDGKGYPDGLKGENIPFLSRILSVADAFDAMITDRPYRAGMSIKEAKREIERFSGTQFDPYVVQAFFEVLAYEGS